jgi:hypothetical protein
MTRAPFEAVRARRAHRADVARALAAEAPPRDDLAIEWAQLGQLPPWCLWAPSPRARLVRIVGALFAAPGMRLWIAGAQIAAARALVGADLFERVLRHPALPLHAPPLPLDDELGALLDGAGRAVLLGSLGTAWMRHFAVPRLPLAGARSALCPPAIARPLVHEGLRLLASEDPSP